MILTIIWLVWNPVAVAIKEIRLICHHQNCNNLVFTLSMGTCSYTFKFLPSHQINLIDIELFDQLEISDTFLLKNKSLSFIHLFPNKIGKQYWMKNF